MSRLDKERQEELEPQRIEYAVTAFKNIGLNPVVVGKRIEFEFKGKPVFFYPYSGWHTGKTIQDGRGIQKLLKQLK